MLTFHRTTLFCRNLGVLLGSGVAADDDAAHPGRHDGDDRAIRRSGCRWSSACATAASCRTRSTDTATLPPMAVRMLRLGRRDRVSCRCSPGRVAEFYEAKLQRSLDRVVGIVGPAAIIAISIIVGGLIVSVMTALLSVSQIVG